ncbi:MAG: hypothetical protein ACLS97_07915 [Alistipes onderdonkii]|jgi:hypothetical protein|uniref:hypothetical protein n=1 Tax=Alistipes onderdonkii TaxID=328813 RepID=UPI003A26BD13
MEPKVRKIGAIGSAREDNLTQASHCAAATAVFSGRGVPVGRSSRSVGFAFASTDGTSGYGFDAGLSLGAFEIRPSSHIGLSIGLLTLDYSYLSYSGTGVNGVSFQLGISPTVGFKYYF